MRIRSVFVIVVIALAGCAGGGGGAGQHTLPAVPAAAGSGGSPTASTTPHFTIVDLGANVDPHHINDAGAVVGAMAGSGSQTGAFVWSNGFVQTLPPLAGYQSSSANWINDSGEIVGVSDATAADTSAMRATRWAIGGGATDLGVPSGYDYSWASSVNSSGAIIGTAAQNNGLPAEAFEQAVRFDGNGGATASDGSIANAINEGGEIVGALCCPYGFPDMGMEAFTDPPFTVLTMPANAGDGATATDLNDNGDVVGYYSAGPFNRYNATCCGFYKHGNTVTEIDDPSGHNYLVARAINGNDWIVGSFGSYGPPQARAFLYNGSVVDLNTLIPANCGWVLNDATSINATGQIVGTGTINGVQHGFLLNPVK